MEERVRALEMRMDRTEETLREVHEGLVGRVERPGALETLRATRQAVKDLQAETAEMRRAVEARTEEMRAAMERVKADGWKTRLTLAGLGGGAGTVVMALWNRLTGGH